MESKEAAETLDKEYEAGSAQHAVRSVDHGRCNIQLRTNKGSMDLTNLSALSEKMKSEPFSELHQVLQAYKGDDWLPFAHPNPQELVKTRVYLSETLEILLLSWPASYSTLPHDHADNGCWLKVLRGQLVETRYSTDFAPQPCANLRENEISFMSNNLTTPYHSIASPELTWSLHVDSPPFHKTRYLTFVK